MSDLLNITVGSGKYTVVMDDKGYLSALRYGEPWRDCCGDNLVYALASEVESLRAALEKVSPQTKDDYDSRESWLQNWEDNLSKIEIEKAGKTGIFKENGCAVVYNKGKIVGRQG